MPNPAFQIFHPVARTTGVVFASPHSGSDYHESFMSQTVLDRHRIRSSEDAFVDRLFDAAPDHGAPLIVAGAPRSFVDLNRGRDELDPALIEGVKKAGHNPRIASGLGVIPRVVANGQRIYGGKLPLEEARRRIDGYWRPYHDALKTLLADALAQFGEAVLIDCHSMPHEAMDAVRKGFVRRPDVVLGDRFGAAAGAEVVEVVEAAFAAQGFTVAHNTPFAGAYVTQAYGSPSRKQHAIQIEIDRSVYMNEKTVTPNADFDSVRRSLGCAIADITAFKRQDRPLAAE